MVFETAGSEYHSGDRLPTSAVFQVPPLSRYWAGRAVRNRTNRGEPPHRACSGEEVNHPIFNTI
jgi:hypothetical protein